MATNPVNANVVYTPPLYDASVKRASPGSSPSPGVPVIPAEAIQSTVSLSVSYQLGSNSHETPVDSEKVANAKKAIANGSYWNTHDSEATAGKIIDLESQLA